MCCDSKGTINFNMLRKTTQINWPLIKVWKYCKKNKTCTETTQKSCYNEPIIDHLPAVLSLRFRAVREDVNKQLSLFFEPRMEAGSWGSRSTMCGNAGGNSNDRFIYSMSLPLRWLHHFLPDVCAPVDTRRCVRFRRENSKQVYVGMMMTAHTHTHTVISFSHKIFSTPSLVFSEI